MNWLSRTLVLACALFAPWVTAQVVDEGCIDQYSSCVAVQRSLPTSELKCGRPGLYGRAFEQECFKKNVCAHLNVNDQALCESGQISMLDASEGLFVHADGLSTDLSRAMPNTKKHAQQVTDAAITNVIGQDGTPAYCPLRRCDVSTGDVRFVVPSFGFQASLTPGQEVMLIDGHSVDPSSCNTHDAEAASALGCKKAIRYWASQVGDLLCIRAAFGSSGAVTMGCKTNALKAETLPPFTGPQPKECKMFCSSTSPYFGKAHLQLSGRMVACVKSFLDKFVFGDEDSNCAAQSIVKKLHYGMRGVAIAMMVLSVIMIGIRITSDGSIKKSSMLGFVLKLSVVVWITLGSGQPLKTFYEDSVEVMSDVSNIVISAGTVSKTQRPLCYFPSNEYQSGWSYIAPFDSLDCRVAYYLGIVGVEGDIFLKSLFKTILAFIFSGQILGGLLLIVYAIFVVSIMIYFVNFYLLSLVILAVTVALGAITVPMMLFEQTKAIFSQWLKLIIGTIGQVVIVSGFMAICFITYDRIIFGECEFSYDGSQSRWKMTETCEKPRAQCKDQFGYYVFKYLTNDAECVGGKPVTTASSLFFDYDALAPGVSANTSHMLTGLLKAVLIGFVLMIFSDALAQFASALAGGVPLSEYLVKGISQYFDDFTKGPKAKLQELMQKGVKKGAEGMKKLASRRR